VYMSRKRHLSFTDVIVLALYDFSLPQRIVNYWMALPFDRFLIILAATHFVGILTFVGGGWLTGMRCLFIGKTICQQLRFRPRHAYEGNADRQMSNKARWDNEFRVAGKRRQAAG
jgi:hypothetical protein